MSRPPDSLAIRPGADGDIPAVIALMKSALGEGNVPRTQEFWHWKHRENPFGPSPMWLAFDAERLVGVRLFLRWRLHAGPAAYSAVRAVDTATHPDYQGKGIFKRLTLKLVEEEQRAGTHLIFNTPNQKSRPGYLKMGWSTVGKLAMWVRPCRPLRLLRAALRGVEAAEDEGMPLDDAISPRSFDVATEAGLLASDDTQPRFHTHLDLRYLSWRYRAPGLRYAALSEAEALIVFRLRRRGALRELRLCDAVIKTPSVRASRAFKTLVQRAIRRYEPDYVIASLRPELAAMLPFAVGGFVPAPAAGPILTVRRLALPASAPSPEKLVHWSASIGDLELF
jgi:GNAT superfamily N-acetyltransferase